MKNQKRISEKNAALDPSVLYLTEKQVSAITGFALSTLRNKRFAREGIPYSKIGRSVRYKLRDVLDYMDRHKIETTDNPCKGVTTIGEYA